MAIKTRGRGARTLRRALQKLASKGKLFLKEPTRRQRPDNNNYNHPRPR